VTTIVRPTPLEVRDHPACRPAARLCSATLSRAEHATEPGLHATGLCCTQAARCIEMGEAHRSRG
jgi:hypothetical protein